MRLPWFSVALIVRPAELCSFSLESKGPALALIARCFDLKEPNLDLKRPGARWRRFSLEPYAFSADLIMRSLWLKPREVDLILLSFRLCAPCFARGAISSAGSR